MNNVYAATKRNLDGIASGINRHPNNSQQSGELVAGGVHVTFTTDLKPYIPIKEIAGLISQYCGLYWEDMKARDNALSTRNYTIITREMMNYFELPLEISIASPENLNEFVDALPETRGLNLNNLVVTRNQMKAISRLVHLNYLNLKGSDAPLDPLMERIMPHRDQDILGRNCDNFTLILESGETYIGEIRSGRGKFKKPDEKFGEGDCVLISLSGTYIGQMQNGKKEGQGVLSNSFNKGGEKGIFKNDKLIDGEKVSILPFNQGNYKEIVENGILTQSIRISDNESKNESKE